MLAVAIVLLNFNRRLTRGKMPGRIFQQGLRALSASRRKSSTTLIFGSNTDVGKSLLVSGLCRYGAIEEGRKTRYVKSLSTRTQLMTSRRERNQNTVT